MINLNEHNSRVALAEKIIDAVNLLKGFHAASIGLLTNDEIALMDSFGNEIFQTIWYRLNNEIIATCEKIATGEPVEYDKFLDEIY